MQPEPPILISDDDEDVQTALRILFKSAGYPSAAAFSPEQTLEMLDQQDFGLVMMDLNFQRDTTSGVEGLALLEQIRARQPLLPVVVMTGWGNVELAVSAMRQQASDFIEKPWDNLRLLNLVSSLLALQRSQESSERLREENTLLKRGRPPSQWIVSSPAMRKVMGIAEQVAGTDINILLTGENGTGKSMLASLIHERSRRAQSAFVAINMSAIPDTLFESELYGHVKGAFTDARSNRMGRFELAEGGTLFMDEIGDLPAVQQAKLLHVLESRQYEKLGCSHSRVADVRIIAATNADLPALVDNGRFRRDLHYRLKGIEIHVPPLRQRREDIMALAQGCLRRFADKYGRAVDGFDERAIHAMEHYAWPGNVRELTHVVERAVLLARHRRITAADLGLADTAAPVPAQELAENWDGFTLEDAERQMLQLALRRHGGNVTAAARALGLSRSAFYRRLEKHGC
ncbi:sigma-54-dependent transcriptional regulator [Stenotrophomonas forensis]|uniref:sigma-54-dependent transcriptional regulator n=1 Tax=Stenotrophomonas forensis TaxID=2871169 RepID=UPI0036D6F318